MRRSLYGHDYKPPSHALRNWLIAIAGVIGVVTFVWKTYDPQTLRLMSGIRPEGESCSRRPSRRASMPSSEAIWGISARRASGGRNRYPAFCFGKT